MKLEKITWLLIFAGVAYVLLVAALDFPNVESGVFAPENLVLHWFGAVQYFFFAAVVEFLARIARALEGAADAIDK